MTDSTHPITGPDVSPADAHQIAATETVLLLDVREDDEWDRGHAAGAVHVPLGQLNPAALDTAVPVIAICRSGNRSSKAALRLTAAGLQVRNMAGGMTAWQEQGLPMVRDDGSPGNV